jgi:hypothetical protein
MGDCHIETCQKKMLSSSRSEVMTIKEFIFDRLRWASPRSKVKHTSMLLIKSESSALEPKARALIIPDLCNTFVIKLFFEYLYINVLVLYFPLTIYFNSGVITIWNKILYCKQLFFYRETQKIIPKNKFFNCYFFNYEHFKSIYFLCRKTIYLFQSVYSL